MLAHINDLYGRRCDCQIDEQESKNLYVHKLQANKRYAAKLYF